MAKEKNPPAFQIYAHEAGQFLSYLTDEQAGALFKDLYRYFAEDIKPEEPDPVVTLAFGVLHKGVDDGKARYRETCIAGSYGAYCKAEGESALPREEWEKHIYGKSDDNEGITVPGNEDKHGAISRDVLTSDIDINARVNEIGKTLGIDGY